MTRGQGLLLVGLAVAAVAVWGALLSQLLAPPGSVNQDARLVEATEPPGSATPVPSASPTPTPAPSPEPTSTIAPEPTVPAATPAADPDASREAFFAFLARMDATRVEANRLSQDLAAAGRAVDTSAVGATAAAMDELVVRERSWLAANPPAPCYAAAHEVADDLLAAYGAVADHAARWAASRGIEALGALGDLYTAVEDATALAADVDAARDAVTCLA